MRRFRVPGRVNLMGDHTDYNEGLVLPVAIDRACVIESWPAAGRVRIRSAEDPEPVDLAADGSERARRGWGRYVAGVLTALAARGRPAAGLEAVVRSELPLGAGLGSSAALEVACAVALCNAARWTLPPNELAGACREAEESATGVPCGIMDQLASISCRRGAALLIDCRTLDARRVPLPRHMALVVAHSGVERRLETSPYAARRRACEEAAAALGVRSLRDATAEQVAEIPLARHVASENGRVAATAAALARGDVDAVGRLFLESHASLRDDFGCSTPELDALVERLVGAGAAGARLTGAGFGGSVVAVASADRGASIAEAVPRAFVCRAADGATMSR